MSADDISEAVEGFAQAARRAQEAVFDGVEVHGANGHLLDQFLTAHTNLREDRYGGSLANRQRLTADVIQAVRRSTTERFVVGVRTSQGKVNDFTHKWEGGEADAAQIFGTLGALPIDYLHTTEFEAWRPAFGEHGPSLAALARRHVAVPVLANGSLHDATQAAGVVARQEADFVSLGRGALMHAPLNAIGCQEVGTIRQQIPLRSKRWSAKCEQPQRVVCCLSGKTKFGQYIS